MKLFPIIQRLWFAPVVLLAFALRITGINWDEGTLQHPDERFMGMVLERIEFPTSPADWFDTGESSFNPYNRGFDTYVYGTLPLLVGKWATQISGAESLTEIVQTGRILTVLWSTGTVFLLIGLARQFGSRRFAAVVGLFMALCVFPIQQSHFFTADSPAVFFTVLCLFAGLAAFRTASMPMTFLTGFALACALACRINLGLLAIWCLLLVAAQTRRFSWRTLLRAWGSAAVLSLALFRILQPYAFEATGWFPTGLNPLWLDDLRRVHGFSDGSFEVPFTMQWVGRAPYLYALYNLAGWGMGWALGLLALGGWILCLVQGLRKQPCGPVFLLALWPLFPIFYHGGVFLHTMRYFLPAYPALILCGCLALRQLDPFPLRRAVALVLLTLTGVWCVAFLNTFDEPHNRISASEWIYETLPPGSTILCEHWDDNLPLSVRGKTPEDFQYRILEFEGYHPDTPQKIQTLVDQLDQADMVVLASRRLAESIPRMPLRYPATTRYYERLESKRLGWTLAAEFHHRPNLGDFEWETRLAEEAFRVYDHPVVRIYKKDKLWDRDVAYQLLTRNIDFNRIPKQRYLEPSGWNRGFLSGKEKTEHSQSYYQRFPENRLGNRQPVFVWLLILLFLGWLQYPLQSILFPSLPDRGWMLQRLIALFAITVPAWWLASLHLVPFPRAVSWCLFLLFAINTVVFSMRYEDLLRWLQRRWKLLLGLEGLFILVFAFFLILRMRTPELWHPWAGGEKPMDFAFLQSVAIADFFPAENPWLSGAFINYYNFGFHLVASLLHLTGVPPSLAYNLALPSFAALTAGTAYTFTVLVSRAWKWRHQPAQQVLTGGIGIFLTLIAGNLAQIRYLLFERDGHPRDGYWNASRAINVPEGEVEPITEFPFFSQLYGDLHAHVLAMPVTMLCLLLSWQLFRRFSIPRALLTAIPIAFLYPLNAWDQPIQIALYTAAVLAPMLWKGWNRQRLIALLAAVAVMKFAAWPFSHRYLAPSEGIDWWHGPKSSLVDLFLAHGQFLVPIALALVIILQRYQRLHPAPLWHRLSMSLILLGGLMIIPMVEFIHLKGDVGRMNFVFKFYYQLWWILAAFASVALIRLYQSSLKCFVVSLLFLLAACAYPFTAPHARYADRFWERSGLGLHGTSFMHTGTYWHDEATFPLAADREGMEFLKREARLSDVIMEAHVPEYGWGGRFSIHAGNPTVLGWNWHMRQQRPMHGDQEVFHRANDIARAYTTMDSEERRVILQRYKVRYITLGYLERLEYGDGILQAFANDPNLRQAFLTDGLLIYEVKAD